MYDARRAEEFVGEVLKIVGRGKVFVTTKILLKHLASENKVLKAAKASLKRLGVSEVDLFLIHWPNSWLTIEEQARNFEAVYLKGLARYIGVSNFNLSELKKAIEATRKAEIVVNQVYYSVLNKSIEKDLLPYAIKSGITIQAYTPLEKGAVISNKTIRKIAEKIGKTPVQVTLNYLISRPRTIPIPKTERKNHVEEILGSMRWRLSEKDIGTLEELSKWYRKWIL